MVVPIFVGVTLSIVRVLKDTQKFGGIEWTRHDKNNDMLARIKRMVRFDRTLLNIRGCGFSNQSRSVQLSP